MAIKETMQLQLGMNPSTASHALKKELMFSLVQQLNQDVCFQCGKVIETSKELSVEHKTPWLHSEDPKGMFFDLDNITFSHRSCNSAAARTTTKKYHSEAEVKAAKRESERRLWIYDPEKRKAQYQRTGK
jgi:5-methylcytosine-specific restriction endonuclease McrA